MRFAPPTARAAGILVLLLAVSGAAIRGAQVRTSLTFDELPLIGAGVRGITAGYWDLTGHGPLTQYMYGVPVLLAGPHLPDPDLSRWAGGARWGYGRDLFFGPGNDPEHLTALARWPALGCAWALIILVFAFAYRTGGLSRGALAGTLVAFLPDVLAHGAVAYNDVPLAVAFLGALLAADAAVRRPSIARGAAAGALAALAFTVKFSAVALGPAILILAGAEAGERFRDPAWRRALAGAGGGALAGAYACLVVVYRGDVLLREAVGLIVFGILHVSNPLGSSPGYLLGETGTDFRSFFPIAFLVKTPVAFHALGVVAAFGLRGISVRDALRSPLRAPAAGALVFGLALLASRKNIGFRYALPVLPLLALLVAAGALRASESRLLLRRVVFALALLASASSLSYFPHFLAYTSEYLPSRDRGHEVLADSNLDWGQGLIELRTFMAAEGVDRVALSYFGSAPPEGYGIRYVALPSFFPLLGGETDAGPPPRFVVISATHLVGLYLPGDPFRAFRERAPDRVLGHVLLVYDRTRGALPEVALPPPRR